jgi:hypothetical protein
MAWQWFIGRMAISPCLFYEWQWGDCLSRWWFLLLGGALYRGFLLYVMPSAFLMSICLLLYIFSFLLHFRWF